MKNRSCFSEWLTKEVINHKSRRNCQEFTGRLMLGEQHLAVGNSRNPHSRSFNTRLNKTPREHGRGRATASRQAIQKAFPPFPPSSPASRANGMGSGARAAPTALAPSRAEGPGRARRKRPPPARRWPMGGGRGPRRGEQARRGRRDALRQPPARPGRAGTAPPATAPGGGPGARRENAGSQRRLRRLGRPDTPGENKRPEKRNTRKALVSYLGRVQLSSVRAEEEGAEEHYLKQKWRQNPPVRSILLPPPPPPAPLPHRGRREPSGVPATRGSRHRASPAQRTAAEELGQSHSEGKTRPTKAFAELGAGAGGQRMEAGGEGAGQSLPTSSLGPKEPRFRQPSYAIPGKGGQSSPALGRETEETNPDPSALPCAGNPPAAGWKEELGCWTVGSRGKGALSGVRVPGPRPPPTFDPGAQAAAPPFSLRGPALLPSAARAPTPFPWLAHPSGPARPGPARPHTHPTHTMPESSILPAAPARLGRRGEEEEEKAVLHFSSPSAGPGLPAAGSGEEEGGRGGAGGPFSAPSRSLTRAPLASPLPAAARRERGVGKRGAGVFSRLGPAVLHLGCAQSPRPAGLAPRAGPGAAGPGPASHRRRAPRSRVPPPNFQKLRRHFLTYLAQCRRRQRGGPGAQLRSRIPGAARRLRARPGLCRAMGAEGARGAGGSGLFNLAAALGIVWGVRCSAARGRMEGAGATWRPPSGARSPGRGATPAGRPRQRRAERGKQGAAHARGGRAAAAGRARAGIGSGARRGLKRSGRSDAGPARGTHPATPRPRLCRRSPAVLGYNCPAEAKLGRTKVLRGAYAAGFCSLCAAGKRSRAGGSPWPGR
ncbi:collagen alpha-1(I) chain-like [Serinus canaria]|uniref:collagen alpha-1(I) chain-like n=1 Tax=Serinus canaria TaxID=9135 RepID=UPI0021CCDB6B|nr:collagen alpha-1(I) chain-like [Serinus canaria]